MFCGGHVEFIRIPLTLFLLRKPADFLDIESVLFDQIPVIRRFTGGGTVIVDPGTIFVTFLYATNMLFLDSDHILGLLCLGPHYCTTMFSRGLGISTFVRMVPAFPSLTILCSLV